MLQKRATNKQPSPRVQCSRALSGVTMTVDQVTDPTIKTVNYNPVWPVKYKDHVERFKYLN